MKQNYEDIINLPHHVSRKHPQMSLSDRAAQFSPFAALTGYGDTIRETRRLTERRIELEEEQKQQLDERLQYLVSRMAEKPLVQVEYFVPDQRKEGGEYRTVQGRIRKLDIDRRELVMEDLERIEIEEILSIESALFRDIEMGT